MELRAANDRHVPDIVDLWQEFSDFHADKDPRYPMVDNVREGYEAYLRGLMQEPTVYVIVAIEDMAVTGFCIGKIIASPPGFKRDRYGEIDELAVGSRYRRRGTGSSLVKNVMDWFKSNGIDFVELDVVSRNPGGIAFWEKQGFRDYQHRMFVKS